MLRSYMKLHAVEEARRALKTPGGTPKLAHDFYLYLIPILGLSNETFIRAYTAYCQIVLNMECEEKEYELIEPNQLKWWADKVIHLKLNHLKWWTDNGFCLN